eukprot:SAG11_NODE_13147_length_668_cov_0.620387_1_plen_42_part_10
MNTEQQIILKRLILIRLAMLNRVSAVNVRDHNDDVAHGVDDK